MTWTDRKEAGDNHENEVESLLKRLGVIVEPGRRARLTPEENAALASTKSPERWDPDYICTYRGKTFEVDAGTLITSSNNHSKELSAIHRYLDITVNIFKGRPVIIVTEDRLGILVSEATFFQPPTGGCGVGTRGSGTDFTLWRKNQGRTISDILHAISTPTDWIPSAAKQLTVINQTINNLPCRGLHTHPRRPEC